MQEKPYLVIHEDTYWEKRYAVREAQVPSFLNSKEVLHKIVTTVRFACPPPRRAPGGDRACAIQCGSSLSLRGSLFSRAQGKYLTVIRECGEGGGCPHARTITFSHNDRIYAELVAQVGLALLNTL